MTMGSDADSLQYSGPAGTKDIFLKSNRRVVGSVSESPGVAFRRVSTLSESNGDKISLEVS